MTAGMIFDPADSGGGARAGASREGSDRLADDRVAYLAKYGTWIGASLGGPHKMAQTYSMPILITPTRGTAFQG